ncbi:MAG: ABC transporter permease, partial [Acidobacteria bacterium]|nr:ABC transporter permease [Acidobacteriota bacterium]
IGLAGVEPNDALKEQTRSVTGDRRFGLRNVLVVSQVALSLVLVIGAGLFVRTFTGLANTPLGFDPSPLLIINVNATRVDPANDARVLLYDRAREVVAAVPGVRSVAASFMTPVSGSGWNGRVLVEGGPELPVKDRMIWVNPIQPGWFTTYGMAMKLGRDFSRADVKGGEPVVIVNETFVKRFVGTQNAIGARIKEGIGVDGTESHTIIGVVNDAVYRNARSGVYATIYLPLPQAGSLGSGFALTANIAGDRAATRRAIAEALTQSDSRLAFTMRDYSDQVRASVGQERLVAMLSGFFGALALLLAGLGLYGVTSYSVNRRRSEIAVRMALGATASGVVAMVLRRVGWLVATGIVIGLGLTFWAATFAGSLLFGLKPRDPLTFVGAALMLFVTGIAAGWLPARRAAKLDPTVVLRD